jgi:hypothetical protein
MLVRVLALVLGLQLTNGAHLVEDVVALVTAEHAEHEQCPADKPCDDCPAGCPQCHCGGGLRSVAPPAAEALTIAFDVSVPAAHAPSEQAPIAPELPGLLRPPKIALVS